VYDNRHNFYHVESWNEQVSKPGRYKGCLIFDESIYLQEESSFQFHYVGIGRCFIGHCPFVPSSGKLGSFGFDRYALHGSLFESDTDVVELVCWETV
jgi:hypothetical protein